MPTNNKNKKPILITFTKITKIEKNLHVENS
jgi:hypothetical protein